MWAIVEIRFPLSICSSIYLFLACTYCSYICLPPYFSDLDIEIYTFKLFCFSENLKSPLRHTHISDTTNSVVHRQIRSTVVHILASLIFPRLVVSHLIDSSRKEQSQCNYLRCYFRTRMLVIELQTFNKKLNQIFLLKGIGNQFFPPYVLSTKIFTTQLPEML